jgi:hypothetical protein
MSKPPATSIGLRIRYQGAPPIHWTGGPADFGLQDKDEVLLLGRPDADGLVLFDISVEVRSQGGGAPLFLGPLTHGSPASRFLYLSWRNADGAYAMRFKLPLGAITSSQVERALRSDDPILGDLIVPIQRATKTGANVGGTRLVVWS